MGYGAKIFLISMLIALCVFGLVSFVIVSSVRDSAEDVSYSGNGENVPLPESVTGESFSILTVFTEDNGSLLSAVLLRVDRERSELTFTPICPKTTVNDTDLSALYAESGIVGFIRGVYLLTGISADHYAVLNTTSVSDIVDAVGNVRFTFNTAVTAGATRFEAGSTTLTGAQATALIRYDTENCFREESAADIVRSICERLSLADGEGVYAKMVAFMTTTFSKGDFAARKGLIASYTQMQKNTVYLCGTYRGSGDARYFVSDVEATLDMFSKYRKYYN